MEAYDDRVLAGISHGVRHRAENTLLWVTFVFKGLSSVEGWNAVETIRIRLKAVVRGVPQSLGHGKDMGRLLCGFGRRWFGRIRRAEQEAVLEMQRVVNDRWGLSHLCRVGRAFAVVVAGEGGAYDSVAIMEDTFDPCSVFP